MKIFLIFALAVITFFLISGSFTLMSAGTWIENIGGLGLLVATLVGVYFGTKFINKH